MALIAGSIPFHRQLFGDNGFGLCAVIAVIACVKLSDTTAYAVGKLFGKHRLAARISAGKTIEGAFGAFIGGIGGAMLMFMVITPLVAGNDHQPGILWTIGYGIFLTIFGMLGDLAESIIKREAHCKDSSAWVPGLGGILDIIDSLTFAAPASCLYWVLFP
jgi:phosphatidate cytidylyltransferase